MAAVLKFLRFSNGPTAEKDLEIIDKATQYAQSNQIDVEIIRNPEEIKVLLSDGTPDMQSIYICFPFEGKIFETLKDKGYRIIGPQCVISCLLLEIPVPKQDYPICNVSMLNVVACCSSMKKDERNSIHELILLMGGTVTSDFTNTVTHLIAKEVGSKKYQVSCSNKIPVVSPSWVHSCWTRSKYEHIVGTDDCITSEFKLPVFKGCTVCVTGIDMNTRESIKSLLHKNGGVYSGELSMKTCTHLLVEYPKGQKYTYARQWKLHCVSPEWFYDCLKKEQWLEEQPYTVEPDSDGTINQSLYQKNMIQNTFRESILPNNSISTTSKAAEVAAKRLSKQKPSGNETETVTGNLKFKSFDSKTVELEKFQCPEVNSYYLDGCRIYLCSKTGPISDYCRKVINNAGGIRFSNLSDTVTHIIIWDQVTIEVNKFLNEIDGPIPHVVSPLWLIDSFKDNEMKEEKAYTLLDILETTEPDFHIDEVFVHPEPKVTKPPQTAPTASSLHINFEDVTADDATLLDQYLSNNHESTRLSQINTNRKSSSDTNKETTLLDEDETVTLEEPAPAILKETKFSAQRFAAEQTNNIKNLIEEFGGTFTEDIQSSDHIIVPLSYNKKMKINKKEVTLCWLEQSLEQEELNNPKSSFLFRPILITEKCKPLNKCVITISQYAGMERQHLFHLAELLGGTGQEYFVRNDSETMKASTHLILMKPEGSKYNASLKWKVPCVSKQWLFKCAQRGKRLPETDFPVTDDETVIEEENITNNSEVSTNNTVAEAADIISFQLSNRGASILDVDKNDNNPDTTTEIIKENSTIKVNSTNNVDFSTFNKMIAEERDSAEKDTITENDNNNKENLTKTPTIPFKPALELNRSHYSFDFTDALDTVQSPALNSQDSRRKSRKSRGSLPMDLQFVEAIEKAVNKHVPESDRIAWSQHEGEKKKENSGILKELIIVVSKKLAHRQMELHNIVNLLGGNTQFLYDSACTHFIHQGRMNDNSKDYNEAKKDEKFLVSPYWLESCVDTSSRADESKYPITYNPRMSIDVSSSRTTRSKISEKKSPNSVASPRTKSSSTTEKETSNGADEIGDGVTISALEEKLDFQKKMEEIMEATKAPRVRKSRRQASTSVSKSDSSNNLPNTRTLKSRNSSQKSIESSRSSHSDPSLAKTTTGVEHISEQSQSDYITYDDPNGRLERERILAQLKRASPSQDVESLHYPIANFKQPIQPVCTLDDLEEVDDIKEEQEIKEVMSPFRHPIQLPITNESPKSEPINLLHDDEEEKEQKKTENSKNYKFLLSGMTAQEKIDYGAIIEKLGGVAYDVQYFNVQCSHVVISAPSRNEKFLATVACGKWALHKSYLEASREHNKFVNEEDHEWGSQGGASDFASAAKRWRVELSVKRITNPKVGAFTGWVVLLCIEPSKQPGFKRILEAGGAQVVSMRPPFENADGATHAFIGDKKQAAKTNVDFERLHNAGIWILKPEYISDYLTVYPKPPVFNYILDEAKALNDHNTSIVTPGKRKAEQLNESKQKRTRR